MPIIRADVVGPVTLVLGDCLFAAELTDFVPPGSAAAIVTDPPYCSGGFTEASRRTAKSMGVKSEKLGWFEGDNMTTLGLQFLLRAMAVDSWTMLRKGGTLSMFMDWRMIPALAPAIESARLRWQQLVVWDKKSAGLGNGFRAQHETLLHFAKGVPLYHGASNGNVLSVGRPRSADREHPTEKPVDLLSRIIDTVAEPDALLVDWFGGAGSLGVAAIATGRRAVVYEVDPVFHERAVERCRAELSKGRMFAPVAARPEQDGLAIDEEPEPEPEPMHEAINRTRQEYNRADAARRGIRCSDESSARLEKRDEETPDRHRALTVFGDIATAAAEFVLGVDSGNAGDMTAVTCGLCHGSGLWRGGACPECRGEGILLATAEPASNDVEKQPESSIGFDDLGDAYESRGPNLAPPAPAYDESAGAEAFDLAGALLASGGELERMADEVAGLWTAPADAFKAETECMRCRGEGWIQTDAGAEDCPRCGGSGDAGVQDQCPAGHTNIPCPKCEGRLNPDEPGTVCPVCNGYGAVNFYAIPKAATARTCTRTGQPLQCWSRLCAAAGRCTRSSEAQAEGALL